MELHPFLETDIRPTPNWWYVLSTSGESPSMRVGHSATFIPGTHADESDKVFIIGGANPGQVFAEVFVLDLKNRAWDTLEATSFRGRYEHAAFHVDNIPGKIFVFGGATQSGNLNDVQSMDISTGVWSDVEVSGTPPSPRTHRSSVVIGPKVYFYSGGHSGPDPVGDKKVHCLDTSTMTWSSLAPRGDSPKPRHGHTMVAIGNRIYLHGGMAGSTFYDDFHILDLDRNTWSSVRKKRTSPPPRAAHDGIVHNNDLYIFGGMSQAGALDDGYKLKTENNSWSKMEFEGPAPPNRLDFAMCSIKLRIPVYNSSSPRDVVQDLTDTRVKAREVLERELKPGSASSRDSFDSTTADEALYSLERESKDADGCQGQQPSGSESKGGGDQTEDEATAKVETEEASLILINGGMDTEGEIFDDTLVMLL